MSEEQESDSGQHPDRTPIFTQAKLPGDRVTAIYAIGVAVLVPTGTKAGDDVLGRVW